MIRSTALSYHFCNAGKNVFWKMRKTLLILSTILTSLCSMAQTAAKDSLLKALATAKEDTSKVLLYIAVGNEYEYEDAKTAGRYYLLAGDLSKKLHYKYGTFKFISNYTAVLNQRGAFDSSLVLSRQSIGIAKEMGDKVKLGKAYANTGNVFQYKNEYDSALFYYETAKNYLEQSNEKILVARMCDLMQNTYRKLNRPDMALALGKEAVAVLRTSNDSISLGMALSNLGTNYRNEDADSALKYYTEALGIGKRMHHTEMELASMLNIGSIYLHKYDADKMKFYYETALKLSKQIESLQSETIASRGMAHYYLYKNNLPEAKKYIVNALQITDSLQIMDEHASNLKTYSSILYAMHDMIGAEQCLDSAAAIDSRLSGDEVQNKTMALAKKFETEKKEAQIKLQQSELRQKNILNYILIGGAAALLLISFLSYRNYKNKQKLQQAKIDELESEKQLTATAAVLKGEEQERTRLAKDLHDGLGGMLSGIKYSLNSMKDNLILTSDNAQAFERSIDMLDSSIREMRRVAHNMMPEILVKYGLDTAMKEFCNEIDRSGVIHVNYQSVGLKSGIDQTTAVTVYRVAQELVNNAIKHAQAKNVLVQLHQSPQEKLLAVTVEDDGNGFDTATLEQAGGIGWRSIKNRVEFLKGKVDIQSSAGNGTSVMIEIMTE